MNIPEPTLTIITEQLNTGTADIADIFLEDRSISRQEFRNGRLIQSSVLCDRGTSARWLSGGIYGVGSSAGLEQADILYALATARGDAHIHQTISSTSGTICDRMQHDDTGEVAHKLSDLAASYQFDLSLIVSQVRRHCLILVPGQPTRPSHRSYCLLEVALTDRRNNYYSSSHTLTMTGTMGSLPLWQEEILTIIQRQTLSDTAASSLPRHPRALITDSAACLLIHELVGHSLEADMIDNNRSLIHTHQLSPRLTVRDDPTDPRGRCGGIDDEGQVTVPVTLIDRGHQKGELLDRLCARRRGVDSNGSSFRESWRHVPLIRCRMTHVTPGQGTITDMLQQLDEGIWIAAARGGQTDASGQFHLHASELYVVQGGKPHTRIPPRIITGSVIPTLTNIQAIGQHSALVTDWCGKDNQRLPVTTLCPPLLITDFHL